MDNVFLFVVAMAGIGFGFWQGYTRQVITKKYSRVFQALNQVMLSIEASDEAYGNNAATQIERKILEPLGITLIKRE